MINRYLSRIVRTALLFVSIVLSTTNLKAQLSGSKSIPADYATIAAFVTDVNAQGVGAGGVTLNVPAGHTEISTGVIALTATGTMANPIIIQKTGVGANPIITSYTGGVGTPSTAVQDGIFALVGSDYVLIDGVDLVENAANTTNPSTMEYGYGFFKASGTDGCQYNLIRNCTVTLNRVNNAGGSGPAFDGSRGINVVNALISAQTTSVTVTSATGSNSFNLLYLNTIQNVNIGIALSGFAAATPFTLADTGNDVGGSSLATANSILNFGGGGTTSPAAGIRTVNQWTLNVSFNTINNNTGAGINHATTLRGILIGAATSANATINNNTVTVISGATTSLMEGISSSTGATAASNTININNNVVQLAYPTATSGSANGIISVSSAATVSINGNTVTSIASLPAAQNIYAGTGTLIAISGGSPATSLTVNNNLIQNFTRTSTAGGTTRGIVLGTSPTQTASGNTVENISYTTATSTGSIDGIYSLSSAVAVNITNNIVRNLSTPTTGTINGIRENTVAGTKTITGNQVYGFSTTAGGAGGASFNGIFTSVGTVTVQNNTIYNLVSTGTTGGTGGTISGVSTSGGTATTISANKIYDLASNSTNPTVNGILISGGTTANAINNLIGDIRAPFANAANPLSGINVTGSTTTNLAYNTVSVNGSSVGALFGSSAVSVSTTPTVNFNNNIFSNTSSANGAGLAVAYRRSTATLTSYGVTSNRNDFVASTIYTDGTTPQATLGAFQALVAPRDALSINQTPNFLSTTGSDANFLHINTSISTLLESGGATFGTVTTDFDNDIRQGAGGYAGSGTAPDMGADEFELAVVNCAAASGGTISPATNTNCAGTTRLITSVGATSLNGITYQWKVSATPGGPYANVVGGTGATTTAYTTGPLVAGTYYYVLETTCSFGPVVGLSNEYTLVVEGLPVAAVVPASATYCIGGTAVALTASGGSTYAWSPAAGLSATTGANVNASPANTTTYSVVTTSAVGCTSLPTTVVVTATATPTITSVTATPPSVCSGASSQLNAVAGVNENYTVSPITYGVVATPGAGVTTLANVGVATTALTSGTLDDGGWNNQTIPFTFNFYGTNYTSFAVSTNGFIYLGPTAPTFTGYNNAFPSAVAANPSIGGTYSDLDFRTIGTINYFVTGTAPNRQLVVNWSGGNFYNAVGAITTQVIIYETTNIIEVHTTNSTGTNNAVQGIQNAGATKFTTAPGRNNTVWTVVAPDAFRFTPFALTYSWTPGTFLNSTTIANPLASGVTATTTYNVTADNGGCISAPAPVTITAGSALSSSATITPSNTVCAGTAITISATGIGGGAPYTYAWTGPNGFTSTSASNPIAAASATDAGLYTVTVTDNCGATSISTVTLTVNALPVVTATPPTSLYCAPGTGITLTANGADTYVWSPAGGLSATTGTSVVATPSANTTYTVVGTDVNGCTASATAIVNSSAAITSVAATATPTTTCDGNSVLTASATLPAANYCQPTYATGTGFGDYVSLVQLNTLNNSTLGAPTPYYTLFPTAGSTTTTLTAGSTYTITLSPGTYTINDLAAWIDFNQNGVLNDAGEKLGETNNLGAAPVTTAFTFTVPLTANNGVTRLRVRDQDYSGTNTMDPCASQSSFGETEDYNITIVGGVDPYTITWSPGTYLSSTTGATVNASGIASNITYTATATTAAGCVNSNTASITLGAPTSSSLSASACGSYTWAENSTTYTSSGAYTALVTNAAGCDSTITLNLTINQSTSSTVSATACNSYTWAQNGVTYTTSGMYPVLVGPNAAGCDSTVTLNLTINQATSSAITASACDSYTWAENGTTYTTSGAYSVLLVNAAGCDSTITLNLTINQATSSSLSASACDSYTWAENGTTYTSSGAYSAVLTNSVGCDSTITLNLTINQATSSSVSETACDSYTWAENGTTYTASGAYVVTLVGSNGCDSLVTLNLTIVGLPVATATDNGDATITASSGTSYQWIDCATNTSIAGATQQTYTATANGDYAVIVTNAGVCSDTSACVTIDYIGLDELSNAGVRIFPNPTNGDVFITMTTATEATIEVVDGKGKLLNTVKVVNGEKVSLASYEAGVYFLRIKTDSGSAIGRIVKN